MVYTEHANHLGIDKPINSDSIYNGAVDEASGAASTHLGRDRNRKQTNDAAS